MVCADEDKARHIFEFYVPTPDEIREATRRIREEGWWEERRGRRIFHPPWWQVDGREELWRFGHYKKRPGGKP